MTALFQDPPASVKWYHNGPSIPREAGGIFADPERSWAAGHKLPTLVDREI